MTCTDVDTLLVGWDEGAEDLTSDERLRIERHLLLCGDCAAAAHACWQVRRLERYAYSDSDSAMPEHLVQSILQSCCQA